MASTLARMLLVWREVIGKGGQAWMLRWMRMRIAASVERELIVSDLVCVSRASNKDTALRSIYSLHLP
jgi:hypothetical protein